MRKVQILGGGCAKCHRLFQNARQAVDEIGYSCDIVKVTDITEMLSFHVLGLPALAIDGQVKVTGTVPSPDEIKSLLATAWEPPVETTPFAAGEVSVSWRSQP